MKKLIWTTRAKQQLSDIVNWLSEFDAQGALRLIQQIRQLIPQLINSPQTGTGEIPIGKYRLIYEIGDDYIAVVQIFSVAVQYHHLP